jgi:hypothetical protein
MPEFTSARKSPTALRKVAARSGCNGAELIPDAIRKVVVKPEATGPVAIWDGEPKRASVERRALMRQGEAAFVDCGAG